MGAHTVPKRLGSDFDESLRVFKVLQDAMESDGAQANGKPYYKFKKGWTDAKIGKETGYDADQIQRFRLKRGMVIKNVGPDPTYHFQPHGALQKAIVDLVAKVALIEGRLQEQGRSIAALDNALAALEDTLTQPKAAE